MDLAEAEDDALFADPRIRRFVGYWRSKRGDGLYPSLDAIDPLDFRYVLGHVMLIEVRRAPTGTLHPWPFRYRLIGANVVERDLTNKTLEDLPEPEYRERVRATWTQVCETGVPVSARWYWTGAHGGMKLSSCHWPATARASTC